MSIHWIISMKDSFMVEWLALPQKEVPHILDKIKLLTEDPTPDAKTKKQLKYIDPRLHRIRCGDYRIFYTFESPYISLLSVQKRKEDTYDDEFGVEFLGGLDPEISLDEKASNSQQRWEQFLAPRDPEPQKLPEPITTDLLTRLKIPEAYHAQLTQITTEEALLDCPDVPGKHLDRLVEALFPKSLSQVMQQPEFLIPNGSDDLLRIKEGELIPFLLRLSPEQEKYVTWAMQSSGPTLLKGGPGTGKSTIALYRMRALLRELRKHEQGQVRVLFTTYTNALVKSSEQLLEQLLGEDMRFVEVQTADKLAMRLLGAVGQHVQFMDNWKVNELLKQAIAQAPFDGTPEQQHLQQQTIGRMSLDYLAQEINQIIVARQLETLKNYLAASRSGRRVRLNPLQRRAVWSVFRTFRQLLGQRSEITWSQARSRAERAVAQSSFAGTYDAVIVDETQDLDPSALRLLVHLCKQPNRLFLTADANQAIYGSSFSWADVHADLRFQGRTALLQTNYRSTSEIGEAAQSYLAGGVLDPEPIERKYVNNGPEPALRRVPNSGEQARLLVNFFQQTRSYFHLSLGACAVLCPTTQAGRAVAADLMSRGVPATFMTGQELDLKRPEAKVLTLQSAKGLEFPIVALAGFLESTWHTSLPTSVTGEEREEMLALERRTMFVGMTRAMRALLVIIPEWTRSPLLSGFSERYWNLGE
jgi:superfamily I DNA/RNA helicase/mRNA-degrading endonuclease RelE of RelBE toxin-antitoxin system